MPGAAVTPPMTNGATGCATACAVPARQMSKRPQAAAIQERVTIGTSSTGARTRRAI